MAIPSSTSGAHSSSSSHKSDATKPDKDVSPARDTSPKDDSKKPGGDKPREAFKAALHKDSFEHDTRAALWRSGPSGTTRASVTAQTYAERLGSLSAPSGKGAAAPLSAQIDPRLSARPVPVTVQPGASGPAGTFTVDSVKYQEDDLAQGRHDVYVRIQDANGNDLPPADVEKYFDVEYQASPSLPVDHGHVKVNDAYGVQSNAWSNGQNSGGPTPAYFDVVVNGSHSEGSHGDETYVWVKPKPGADNPYAGYGTQKVGPFTMPANHHVAYLVTFRATPGATPDPVTSQGPAEPPEVKPAPAYAAGDRVTVNADGVNLRGGPGTGYPVMRAMNTGTPLEVTGPEKDGFVPVRTADNATGWVSRTYLDKAAAAPAPAPADPSGYTPGQSLVVDGQGQLNLRGGPGTDATISQVLEPGTALTVIPAEDGALSRNGFVHVQTPDGTAGWVFAQRTQGATAGSGAPGPVNGPGTVPATAEPGSVYAPYNVAGTANVAGRLGADWPSAWSPAGGMGQVDGILDKMKGLGVGYTVINLSPDQIQATDPKALKAFVDKLNAAGVTPVVRIYEGSPSSDWDANTLNRMADAAEALGNAGVRLIQVGNEPNIETASMPAQEYLARSISNQVKALEVVQQRLQDRGLSDAVEVGMPPMAPGAADVAGPPPKFAPDTYFKQLVDAIATRQKETGMRLVDWVPVHTYLWGDGTTREPGNAVNGARGQMGWGPDAARYYEQWARERLGYDVKALSTEGGPPADTFRKVAEDGPTREAQLARAQKEIDETLSQLQGNRNLTGCLWLDWESNPGSNQWDQSYFTSGDERVWARGLEDLRQAAPD